MKFRVIAGLGIMAIIADWSYSPGAQSQINRNSNRGYTLSGDSLTGIDQRTSLGDFKRFFVDYINSSGNQLGDGVDPNIGVWQLNDQVRLNVNQPVPASTRTLQNFPTQDGFDGIGKLEIQLNTKE